MKKTTDVFVTTYTVQFRLDDDSYCLAEFARDGDAMRVLDCKIVHEKLFHRMDVIRLC